MNLLDIGIIIIITLTTIRGFFRGIIQEAATLLGIIASFFLASSFYKDLALWLARILPRHNIILGIFCFILIFALSMFLFHFLAIMTRGAIRLALLGWLDRALGGLFGLIKGAVITFFLVTILMLFYPDSSPVVKDSRFFPPILNLTEQMTVLIPFKVKDDFFHKKKQLEKYWGGKKRNIQEMEKIRDDEQRR